MNGQKYKLILSCLKNVIFYFSKLILYLVSYESCRHYIATTYSFYRIIFVRYKIRNYYCSEILLKQLDFNTIIDSSQEFSSTRVRKNNYTLGRHVTKQSIDKEKIILRNIVIQLYLLFYISAFSNMLSMFSVH